MPEYIFEDPFAFGDLFLNSFFEFEDLLKMLRSAKVKNSVTVGLDELSFFVKIGIGPDIVHLVSEDIHID